MNGCENMILFGYSSSVGGETWCDLKKCHVNAHCVHGKVERKIREFCKSLRKIVINKNRLSILQWETLGYKISNSINNMPIGLGNKSEMLENLWNAPNGLKVTAGCQLETWSSF